MLARKRFSSVTSWFHRQVTAYSPSLDFISDYIREGVLKLHQVPTYQQVADIGTKALPWAAFSALLYTVLGLT